MNIVVRPPRNEWEVYCQRPLIELEKIQASVRAILEEVKIGKDEALIRLTKKFDQQTISDIRISPEILEEAEKQIAEPLKVAIKVAKDNIEAFHRTQQESILKVETMPGVMCWRKSVAIQNVGIYIPGGTAPLFSSILMLAVPAIIAGCQKIVLCSPPGSKGYPHPAILYTAHLLGITEVYRVGGAQAIAAMTYGTESVPSVDKIFGPGNQYVTMAKQLASQEGVAIDMPAGPSEVAVVVDETAIPAFTAADLLSQAEHGIDSQVILVSNSQSMVAEIQKELQQQLQQLPRKAIAEKALGHSNAIILDSRDDMLEFINLYAPEHLILSLDQCEPFAERVHNAGSIFLGNFTPESIGDYASGTNHTLPTNGYARSYSGVSLDSFVKKITFQKLSKEGIQRLGPYVETMAQAEELQGHSHAVRVRIDHLNRQ